MNLKAYGESGRAGNGDFACCWCRPGPILLQWLFKSIANKIDMHGSDE